MMGARERHTERGRERGGERENMCLAKNRVL